MQHLTERYRQLESKYEELYEERDESNKRMDDKDNKFYGEVSKAVCG